MQQESITCTSGPSLIYEVLETDDDSFKWITHIIIRAIYISERDRFIVIIELALYNYITLYTKDVKQKVGRVS